MNAYDKCTKCNNNEYNKILIKQIYIQCVMIRKHKHICLDFIFCVALVG